MKPPLFAYRDPGSVDEAATLLAEFGSEASVLAGGQSLIPLLNLRLARPEALIDINRLSELERIEVSDEAVRLGALTRVRSVERSNEVAEALPVLAEAVRHIAHPQIRTRTTMGGNVAHADPSSELPGVLAACEGRVELLSTRGTRWVPWSEFFISVFTTSREPDELLTRIEFPRNPQWTFRFRELARRSGDYPLAGVCLGLRMDGEVIQEARVSVIAVADRPLRIPELEQVLVGGRLSDASLRKDVHATAQNSVPAIDDTHASSSYRRNLVGTLLSDTLSNWSVAA